MRNRLYLLASALWLVSLVSAALHSQAPVAPAPAAPGGVPRVTATPPRITTPQPAAGAPNLTGRYVGSLACQRCHADNYERWSHTRMANVVTDPKVSPSVVIPDFSKPDPLVTFKLSDVALVYGTVWKQRYFIRSGDDYYVAPAQFLGHSEPRVAPVFRGAEHRLVDVTVASPSSCKRGRAQAFPKPRQIRACGGGRPSPTSRIKGR